MLTEFGRLRRFMAGVSASALAGALLATIPLSASQGASHDEVVNPVPASNSPDVLNGSVRAIEKVGDTVILGGNFSSARSAGGGAQLTRNNILAFDSDTGQIDNSFVPAINGMVEDIAPGPTPGTIYVAGRFSNVNGSGTSKVVVLNLSDGSRDTSFDAPSLNGRVETIARSGNRLYAGGSFRNAGGDFFGGLVAMNATTGARQSYLNLPVTERHNDTGGGAQGAVGVRGLVVTPDGSRMVIIGNFKRVDGEDRDQAAVIDLGASEATLSSWHTSRYEPYCFNWAFDTYMRGVSMAPDGSYFVITTTGGHNAGTLCDTASRFETDATGDNIQPTWISDTGGDSLWGVETTGEAVYIGGHQRWMNNAFGSDSPGPGAVPRPGLAALDPKTGVPLEWNPGRNPRGRFVYDMAATNDGLWIGSNTEWIGNFDYRRERIARFPLAGGAPVADDSKPDLPGNVYIGNSEGVTEQGNVLYRVNTGGPTVDAIDAGPDWVADDGASSPYRNSGSNAAGWSPGATMTPSVPDATPPGVFNNERWDPDASPEMSWSFPTDPGLPLEVRLYFANRCTCTNDPGERVFDVSVEGTNVLDDYDIAADVGDQAAVMKSYDITSDNAVNIDFGHVTENPLINAIEIVRSDLPPPASGSGSLNAVEFDGTTAGTPTPVDEQGVAWNRVRGGFRAGGYLFYGQNDGALYRRSYQNGNIGQATRLDPYHDPEWANVDTGSGQTYDGATSAFYGQIPNVTGMYYDDGRLFYTLEGDSSLYYRYFSVDSGIVGVNEFEASTGRDWSQTEGMFEANGTVYVASSANGALTAVDVQDGMPSGSGSVVDNTVDWRANSMFLGGAVVQPNEPPTASFTANCDDLTCTFDASGSTDDGSIVSYEWDFGDGTTGAGQTVQRTYDSEGTYNVSLTVTDDDNATGDTSDSVQPTEPSEPPSSDIEFRAAAAVAQNNQNPSFDVPSSVQAGDTLVVIASFGSPDPIPTAPAGWTLVANEQVYDRLHSAIWTRTATADDAGRTYTWGVSGSPKATFTVAAYDGVDSANPIRAFSVDSNRHSTSHVSPTATAAEGDWALSYWTDRTSGTTSWTPPSGVVTRAEAYGGGGGRVTSLLADSGGPVADGQVGGLTATTDVSSSRALSWTIVLRSAGGSDSSDPTDPGGPPDDDEPPASSIEFGAANAVDQNRQGPRIEVPTDVQAGDTLVAIGSFGSIDPQPEAPAGWTLVATEEVAEKLESSVWTRTATADDAGRTYIWDVAGSPKATLTVASYDGVDSTDPIRSFASDSNRRSTSHVSPTTTAADGDWVLSYWTDRTSGTTSWTPPGGVTARAEAYGSGGARVTSLLADSAGPVEAGQVGGLTATTNVSSSRAIAWTIVLRSS